MDLDLWEKIDLDLWNCFDGSRSLGLFWNRKVYFKDEMTNLHICGNFGRVNSHLIDE